MADYKIAGEVFIQGKAIEAGSPPAGLVADPDAPPMLFHLSDGKTLAAFHHNRHSVRREMYRGLGRNPEAFLDRSEIWVSLSGDAGRTWSEPRFLFVNALATGSGSPFRDYQCSYMDMFVDGDVVNLFIPHRWERVLHLQMKEQDLATLPTRRGLLGG